MNTNRIVNIIETNDIGNNTDHIDSTIIRRQFSQ